MIKQEKGRRKRGEKKGREKESENMIFSSFSFPTILGSVWNVSRISETVSDKFVIVFES